MAESQPLRVLLLCNDRWDQAQALLDHVEAFSLHSRHFIAVLNPRPGFHHPDVSFDGFDVVVIHFNVWLAYEGHFPGHILDKLRAFRGLKVQFRQDEYTEVDSTVDLIDQIGLHVLYTIAPPARMRRLYHHASMQRVKLRHTLTGYVPKRLVAAARPPMSERHTDLGYRAREVDWWLGRLGQEKLWISEGVNAQADELGLRCDVSARFEDRIYGEDWIRFIRKCRALLASESGASIVDFDGSCRREVERHRAANPQASWEEMHQAVLVRWENNCRYNMLSPRVFEAAALGAGLVMFEGEYSGVVEPWRHYIPLAQDFSNLPEIAHLLRDDAYMADLAARTHADLIASGQYSYETFISQFDRELCQDYVEFVGPIPARRGGGANGLRSRAWLIRQDLANHGRLWRSRQVTRGIHQVQRARRLLRLILIGVADRDVRQVVWSAGTVLSALEATRLSAAATALSLTISPDDDGLRIIVRPKRSAHGISMDTLMQVFRHPGFTGIEWRGDGEVVQNLLLDRELPLPGLSAAASIAPTAVAKFLVALVRRSPVV